MGKLEELRNKKGVKEDGLGLTVENHEDENRMQQVSLSQNSLELSTQNLVQLDAKGNPSMSVEFVAKGNMNSLEMLQTIAHTADTAYDSIKAQHSSSDVKVSDNPEVWLSVEEVKRIYNEIYSNPEFAEAVRGDNLGYTKTAEELKNLFYECKNREIKNKTLSYDRYAIEDALLYLCKVNDKTVFFDRSCDLKQTAVVDEITFKFSGGYHNQNVAVYSVYYDVYVWDKKQEKLLCFGMRNLEIALRFYFAIGKLATISDLF